MEDRIRELITAIQLETGTRIKKVEIQWTGLAYGKGHEDFKPVIAGIDVQTAKEYKP